MNLEKINIKGLVGDLQKSNKGFFYNLPGINNDAWFKKLNIKNSMQFCSSLVGYKVESGFFPYLKTLEDVEIVIKALKHLEKE
jgi:regulator of sigma D